jgi:hypothetical protein
VTHGSRFIWFLRVPGKDLLAKAQVRLFPLGRAGQMALFPEREVGTRCDLVVLPGDCCGMNGSPPRTGVVARRVPEPGDVPDGDLAGLDGDGPQDRLDVRSHRRCSR